MPGGGCLGGMPGADACSSFSSACWCHQLSLGRGLSPGGRGATCSLHPHMQSAPCPSHHRGFWKVRLKEATAWERPSFMLRVRMSSTMSWCELAVTSSGGKV